MSSHARVELLSQPSGGGHRRRHRIDPAAVAGRRLQCGRVVLRRRALTPRSVAAGGRLRRRVVVVDVAGVAVEQLEVSGEAVVVGRSEVRFARTAQGLDARHRFPVDVLNDLFRRRSGARWRCGVGKEARLHGRVDDDRAVRRNHVIVGGT